MVISRDLEDIETGIASWYGPGFHGKQTANGEIYDQYALTAAHPTLPLGTQVEVTNVETGESVDVRINDRGPYKYGRVIDLSYEAARRIGVWGPGTAPVRVSVLNADGTVQKERVLMVSAYAILIASSTDLRESVAILRQLSRKYSNAYLAQLTSGPLSYYQVRIGPFRSRREAKVLAHQLVRHGTLALVVAEDDQRAMR
ncbi:MAG: septal ring lytic transglycosylase RlpA family protein [Candidatus Binatia bacterium]